MSSADSAPLRRGFTLLEAVAALVIIGLSGAAALAAFGAELRASARVRHAQESEALATHQLTTLRLLPASLLERLPDSVASGRFAPPFAEYQWRASTARRSEELVELQVEVAWDGGVYALTTLRHAPRPEARRR